jgi:probable F420-dependent oxidoreductase
VKVRIGYGLGTRSATNDGERFGRLVDDLERLGFDSLWLSERITGDCPDPLVGMAYACGRTTRLKVGMSVMVLPGRNPVVLAKALASLDRLSGGRLLPAFGLGVADAAEHQAFGVQRRQRGPWFDEALPLMRRLWTEDHVDHDGPRFQLRDVTVRPRPRQQPLDVWLGGIAPLELARVGRLGDGWLPSFCTPEQAAAAKVTVEQVAAAHGREIDPEHFGALIPYSDGDIPDAVAERVRARNPDAAVADVVATKAAIPGLVGRFCERGFSKFVLVPVTEPAQWTDELEQLAAIVGPLET